MLCVVGVREFNEKFARLNIKKEEESDNGESNLSLSKHALPLNDKCVSTLNLATRYLHHHIG